MIVEVKRIVAPPQPPDTVELRIDLETAKTLFDVLSLVGGEDGSDPRAWSRRAYMDYLYNRLWDVLPEYRERDLGDLRDAISGIRFLDRPRPE